MDSSTVAFSILLVFLVLLALIIILILIMHHSKEKIKNEKLNAQELSIQHKKELLFHSIQVQEGERDRLSAELHDGIVSKMNIIYYQLAALAANIENEKLKKDFEQTNRILHQTIDETRQISHELFPVVLESFGLITAIEELIDNEKKSSLNIHFKTNFQNKDIGKEESIHFYRIIQELLSNCVKHSQCTEVTISLENTKFNVVLIYEDNGVGTVESISSKKGLGMKNIQSRLAILNYDLDIENRNPGLRFIFTKSTEP